MGSRMEADGNRCGGQGWGSMQRKQPSHRPEEGKNSYAMLVTKEASVGTVRCILISRVEHKGHFLAL